MLRLKVPQEGQNCPFQSPHPHIYRPHLHGAYQYGSAPSYIALLMALAASTHLRPQFFKGFAFQSGGPSSSGSSPPVYGLVMRRLASAASLPMRRSIDSDSIWILPVCWLTSPITLNYVAYLYMGYTLIPDSSKAAAQVVPVLIGDGEYGWTRGGLLNLYDLTHYPHGFYQGSWCRYHLSLSLEGPFLTL